VGNRVVKIPGGDSSRFCFFIFNSTVNTPTKKKSQLKTPCCLPVFRCLPSKSKLRRKICYNFSDAEGSTLEPNISSSVHILFSIFVLVGKVFWSTFQKCIKKFYDTRSFLIFEKIIGKIVKKYGFFDFLGPELIIPNRTQGGTMAVVSPKCPSFQQKKNRVPRGTTARDI
jgi:hypothetical protein